MCSNRFFRRNGSCACCRCCSSQNDSSAVCTVLYRRHFADVPMRVFYGPGYTERNVLESIDSSLETIAEAADRWQTSSRQGCSRRSHCSCCACCSG